VQRDGELQTAAERVHSLQTWLNRFKNICEKHRDQLVYGSSSVPENWWDKAVDGGERGSFLGQAAGDSATSSAENCLLCDCERLTNTEVRNVRLVAENDSMRKWMQESDELVYQMEQRIAHREGRMPDPRMTSSGSLVERLRVFDSSIARVASEFDRGMETKQRLERLVAQHENSIALLEQRLRETVAGTVAMDELLRQERDLATATSSDLQSAKTTITMLEDSLRQRSTELDEAAIKFDQLRAEAKSRVRDLKSQLEIKEQEYRNLSDAEAKLNMELVQVNDQLATGKASSQQLKEAVKRQLEDNRLLVGTAAVFQFVTLSSLLTPMTVVGAKCLAASVSHSVSVCLSVCLSVGSQLKLFTGIFPVMSHVYLPTN